MFNFNDLHTLIMWQRITLAITAVAVAVLIGCRIAIFMGDRRK